MMLKTSQILLACAFTASPALAQEAWELVWSDEFDGSSLDSSNWSPQIGTGTVYGLPAGWGNNELQYYTSTADNIQVSDGTLKIIARQQNVGGRNYTSARLRTLNKQEFLYGRVEARMILPSTQGIWPAFWMLPTNSPYGIWAASGEIDVMESVNTANRIYGTLHFGNQWPNNQSAGPRFSDGSDFSQGFHTYRVDWEPDSFTWYIDDVPYGTINKQSWYSANASGNDRAPFDTPYHMLLNVAVGGSFPGNPTGSSTFPQTLEVDYVRVYERVQLPFPGDPHSIPGTIEAEDFDIGVQGMSYNDCDTTNNGGEYRETGVDIEASDEGGFNVGWMCEGEWIEYTVNVETAGTYQLDARIASPFTGGAYSIERDGEDLTGTVFFLATGGWQSWENISTTLDLEAGEQVLRFVNEGIFDTAYNFDSLTFSFQGASSCSDADLAEPFGELNFFDVSSFLTAYNSQGSDADMNSDGNFDFFDISIFLAQYNAGCP